MKTIYKYPLSITDVQTIWMPSGAKILSVQEQRDTLCLWAAVDRDNIEAPRTILIVGTGNPMPYTCNDFIGTVQTNGGALVWHVFERLTTSRQ